MVENNPQQDLHSLGRILFCGPAAENATTCEPTLIEVKVTKWSLKGSSIPFPPDPIE